MKKADKSGARLALLWGEEEVAAGQVTVKPLRGSAGQLRIDLEELGARLPEILAANAAGNGG